MLRLCGFEDKGETSSDANCFSYSVLTQITSLIEKCANLSLAARQKPVLQHQWTPAVSFPDTVWGPRSPRLKAHSLQMLSVPYSLDAKNSLFYL